MRDIFVTFFSMASLLVQEIKFLRARLDEFVSKIKLRFNDIVTDIATSENNQSNSLNSVFVEATGLRRLECTGAFPSNQAE